MRVDIVYIVYGGLYSLYSLYSLDSLIQFMSETTIIDYESLCSLWWSIPLVARPCVLGIGAQHLLQKRSIVQVRSATRRLPTFARRAREQESNLQQINQLI